MNDIEEVLYTELREYLTPLFPTLTLSGIEERFPASFPFASVVMAEATTRADTVNSGSYENHTNIMYEINVYSNSRDGRKTEAKSIFSAIDRYFISHGFSRTAMNPVVMDNATIYRITARYTGCADKNFTIYRR